MLTWSVVIPTTHEVEAVNALIRSLRQLSPIGLSVVVVVVDNGDRAEGPWEQADLALCHPDFLGSEVAFLWGLNAAPAADRYLFLDHDAMLGPNSINTLFAFSRNHPDAVLSANQNGDYLGWSIARTEGGLLTTSSDDFIEILGAPWSGLLLTGTARQILLAQRSEYFFFWDDYLASWRLRQAGIELLGVPTSIIGNQRKPHAAHSQWRAYYQSRNELLFLRDTGSGIGAQTAAVFGRSRVAWGVLRRGDLRLARAIMKGIAHGLIDRRGRTISPTNP